MDWIGKRNPSSKSSGEETRFWVLREKRQNKKKSCEPGESVGERERDLHFAISSHFFAFHLNRVTGRTRWRRFPSNCANLD
jgi:hypothetical protein